jgi:hypothetical protein
MRRLIDYVPAALCISVAGAFLCPPAPVLAQTVDQRKADYAPWLPDQMAQRRKEQ